MCGIVGYIGKQEAVPILLDGLKRLEYRGYDSAGVTIFNQGKLTTCKTVGRLRKVEELSQSSPWSGMVGIGHTRWATHGRPSDRNAHPHVDCNRKFRWCITALSRTTWNCGSGCRRRGISLTPRPIRRSLPHLIEDFYEGTCSRPCGKPSRSGGAFGLVAYAATIIRSRSWWPVRPVRSIIGLGQRRKLRGLRYSGRARLTRGRSISWRTGKWRWLPRTRCGYRP